MSTDRRCTFKSCDLFLPRDETGPSDGQEAFGCAALHSETAFVLTGGSAEASAGMTVRGPAGSCLYAEQFVIRDAAADI